MFNTQKKEKGIITKKKAANKQIRDTGIVKKKKDNR